MAQACAVGLITACGAILYDGLIHLVRGLALTSQDHPLYVLPDLPWYQILPAPTLGGLAVGLVGFFRSQDATGHGVPEVIETVHEQVRLPHNYTVEIAQISAHLIGKTLRESQLRNRFNLTAIAIRRGGFHSPDELPDPNSPFHQKDYLVLLSRAEHLRRPTDVSEEQIDESGS